MSFLILEKKVSALHYYDVSCGFVLYGLYYVELHTFLLYSVFFFFFIIKECCVLSNAFSASVGMIT